MNGEEVTETSFLARTIITYEKRLKIFNGMRTFEKNSAKSANLDF